MSGPGSAIRSEGGLTVAKQFRAWWAALVLGALIPFPASSAELTKVAIAYGYTSDFLAAMVAKDKAFSKSTGSTQP